MLQHIGNRRPIGYNTMFKFNRDLYAESILQGNQRLRGKMNQRPTGYINSAKVIGDSQV